MPLGVSKRCQSDVIRGCRVKAAELPFGAGSGRFGAAAFAPVVVSYGFAQPLFAL